MNEELIGLIPAAGKGLRLRLPYPKELYPIIRDNRYKPISQFVQRFRADQAPRQPFRGKQHVSARGLCPRESHMFGSNQAGKKGVHFDKLNCE